MNECTDEEHLPQCTCIISHPSFDLQPVSYTVEAETCSLGYKCNQKNSVVTVETEVRHKCYVCNIVQLNNIIRKDY